MTPVASIRLEDVVRLRQSEELSQGTVKPLSGTIRGAGVWTTIIPAEMASGWVMDVNHLLYAARHLRLEYIPVVMRYSDLPVSVLTWDNGQPYG